MAQSDNTLTVARPLWLAARQGRGFIAGSSAIVIAVAGNIRATLKNPSTSERLIIIDKMVVYSSGSGGVVARVLLNPSTNIPASTLKTVTPLRPGFTGNKSSVAEVRIDTGSAMAAGTGTDTGEDLPVNASTPIFDDPWILDPGQMIGLAINVPLALVGTFTIGFRWFEDTIS